MSGVHGAPLLVDRVTVVDAVMRRLASKYFRSRPGTWLQLPAMGPNELYPRACARARVRMHTIAGRAGDLNAPAVSVGRGGHGVFVALVEGGPAAARLEFGGRGVERRATRAAREMALT